MDFPGLNHLNISSPIKIRGEKMFGWILKTDWDIKKLLEHYAKKSAGKA
jgi:hypothetical protein